MGVASAVAEEERSSSYIMRAFPNLLSSLRRHSELLNPRFPIGNSFRLLQTSSLR